MVKTGSKKPLSDEELFPLYVINQKTLEYIEVPEKYWKIIGNPSAHIKNEDFNEYLDIISKYGLETKVVPNSKLHPYRKRTAKRLKIDIEETPEPTQSKLEL